jgi:predicted permease
MISQIFIVMAPVGLICFLGYVWGRRSLPFDTKMVVSLVSNVGAPCLIISTMLQNKPQLDSVLNMALASLLVVLFSLIVAFVLLLISKQSIQVYLPTLSFPNSGNIGVPICLLAFGNEGLALSVSFFAIMALCQFTIGVGIASGNLSFSNILKTPVLWALIFSMVLLSSGVSIPLFLSNAIDLVAGMVVPLMLMSLGVSLSSLRFVAFSRSVFFSVARLVIGFGVGFLVVMLLQLEGVARAAVLIQSSMPAAIFSYLFSLEHNNQPQEVAGVIVLSTVLSFLTLPVLLGYVFSTM